MTENTAHNVVTALFSLFPHDHALATALAGHALLGSLAGPARVTPAEEDLVLAAVSYGVSEEDARKAAATVTALL